MKLSVIIPVGQFENIKPLFVDDLCNLPAGSEIIFVTAEDPFPDILKIRNKGIDVRYITANTGRAECLNYGASNSTGSYLWFLHADSQFGAKTVSSLLKAIARYPEALLYFDLAFDEDSFLIMKLNEWGAFFRSRILNTPFGDQGFCVKKEICCLLKGFPEDAPYGEDHLFVRNAKRNKISVKSVKARLYTSSRKYHINGWFQTTVLHLYLWLKQIYVDNRSHRMGNIL